MPRMFMTREIVDEHVQGHRWQPAAALTELMRRSNGPHRTSSLQPVNSILIMFVVSLGTSVQCIDHGRTAIIAMNCG
jgi:hypothetical protein